VRYGSPLGAGFGDPENTVAYVHAERLPGHAEIALTFKPAAGCGGWFGIYRNAGLVRNVHAPEGVDAGPFSIPVPRGAVECFFVILRLGALSDPRYHCERVARAFELENSRLATLNWKWKPDIIGAIGDAGQTYNWQFSKISYDATLPTANGYGHWSALGLDIIVDATNVTVNLYRQNTLAATGFAALSSLPDTVTLAEVNGSGVAGHVYVYAAPTEHKGAELLFRWPASMQIYRGPHFGDYGEDPVGELRFNRASVGTWTEPAALDPGEYHYYIRPVSDTGEAGDVTYVTGALMVYGPPAPPTNLHYVSGNAAATVIGWTPSPTPGATYNVYTAADGQPFDLNNPDQTLPAGSSQATLSTFSGYPEKRCVLVRCAS